MELTPAQEQIVSDTHRFRVVVCGRKFGKTTLGAEELKGASIYIPDAKVLYVAPTLSDARGLMWDRLKQQMGAAVLSANDTRLELKVKNVFGGTSTIQLGSWEKIDNYRGFEYDFELFDEVQDYRNFWVGWQEAARATLTPRRGKALFLGTPKGFNHFYDLYNAPYSDSDYQSYRFTTYDNPFIDRDEIEAARKELTESRFAQEYLADFRKSDGLVFKEFNREKHVYTDKVYGYSELLSGVDFGFTNPAAILDVAHKDGCYYVAGELYRTGMTDIQVAEYVAAKNYNKVYPDPESPAAIQEMKRKGVNVREVIKGKDSIKNGIDRVRELFLANKLFIHSSCQNLILELESYSYAEASDSEKPIDQFNHAIDALRYVVMMHKPAVSIPAHTFHDRTIDIWKGK